MGKSAKFFKRPTRKEKAVLSLSKGTDTSLFDSATSSETGRKGSHKKDILSATANPTISKKNSSAAGAGASAAHPPKASLAYKMQLNGGIKAAVKDLKELDEDDLVSEDEDMDEDDGDDTPAAAQSKSNKKNKQDLDKSKPRPDYVELMYGKPGGNKRKTFMPKPALIK
ncbi:hypothetical protein EC991_007259 [Linnemannia zychae]|nr:hypothetical protein EC991_007259 [Linnemannia zychae]